MVNVSIEDLLEMHHNQHLQFSSFTGSGKRPTTLQEFMALPDLKLGGSLN